MKRLLLLVVIFGICQVVACGLQTRAGVAPMKVTEHIISLERSALDRWIRADPDGYLELYAKDTTYFDPFREKRVDGLNDLKARMAPMRNAKLPFTEPRYEMIDPVVRLEKNVAVLTFNLVNFGKPLGSAQETVLARWNATEVYCMVDGEWRIIHAHWSFTLPQLATARNP